MLTPEFNHFLCNRDDLITRLDCIDPRRYDKTRNYLNGGVTWLSPFVTHGILSTQQIADVVLREHKAKTCYRLLFELGWREFFHRTWQLAGDDIFSDMRQPQSNVCSDQLPSAIVTANTGIQVVDECIENLKRDGLLHNHARMWIAGMTCNMAATYWREPARWLHYHLLDGDLASNTLSWQWIAGTFSHKKYVANQANIDKYSATTQPDSWLDVPYEVFDDFSPPEHMLQRCTPDYVQSLPSKPITDLSGEVALRSVWQLDPHWLSDISQHIIFIDTELAQRWPMSRQRWTFIEHWAAQCGAQLCHGTVQELTNACERANVFREEYPACKLWPGKVIERSWLYLMPEQPFNSFSQYFKQVKHHVGL